MADPIAVALKFAFLAVLYLFLIWVARSALKDLRRVPGGGPGAGGRGPASGAADFSQATGMHPAITGLGHASDTRTPLLRVETAPGLRDGDAYDVSGGVVLGRGDEADIRIEDTFASTRHAQLVAQGDVIVLEDMGSTNGTRLNGQPLAGPQPLHPGDRISIGQSEFSFER